MDTKEYRWHVGITRQFYPALQLTFEQAEQVYLMEQVMKDTPAGEYFTDWERLDFELATMRRVLSAEQLARYLPDHAEAVAQHATQLRAQATSEAANLAYEQEAVRFYRETALPTLYAAPELVRAIGMSELQLRLPNRAQFMWHECDQLLRQQWAKTVRQHYHNYRDLAESVLEAQRIRHELQTLWPDYQLFKQSLYKPARLVLQAAMRQADYWLDEHLPQLTAWQQEWSTHLRQRWEHHHGPRRGFVHQSSFDEKKHRQQWQFLFLWLGRTAPPWHPEVPAKRPKKLRAS